MTSLDFSRRKTLLTAIYGGLAVALTGAITIAAQAPFLFPALGATIFIVLWVPTAAPAAPRNVILAHAIGACVGWGCALLLGFEQSSARPLAPDTAHIEAAVLAMCITIAAMILLRVPHPPACATTLTFAMGLLAGPLAVLAVTGGGVTVSACAWLLNRAQGTPYPLWYPLAQPQVPTYGPAETSVASEP